MNKLKVIKEITASSIIGEMDLKDYITYINQLKFVQISKQGNYKIVRYTNYKYLYDYYYNLKQDLEKVVVYEPI